MTYILVFKKIDNNLSRAKTQKYLKKSLLVGWKMSYRIEILD